jgi:hypothetical protein
MFDFLRKKSPKDGGWKDGQGFTVNRILPLRVSILPAILALAALQACDSGPESPRGPVRRVLSLDNYNDTIGVRLILKRGETSSISDTSGALFNDTLPPLKMSLPIELGPDSAFTLMYTWNEEVVSPFFEGEVSTRYHSGIKPLTFGKDMPEQFRLGILKDSIFAPPKED